MGKAAEETHREGHDGKKNRLSLHVYLDHVLVNQVMINIKDPEPLYNILLLQLCIIYHSLHSCYCFLV